MTPSAPSTPTLPEDFTSRLAQVREDYAAIDVRVLAARSGERYTLIGGEAKLVDWPPQRFQRWSRAIYNDELRNFHFALPISGLDALLDDLLRGVVVCEGTSVALLPNQTPGSAPPTVEISSLQLNARRRGRELIDNRFGLILRHLSPEQQFGHGWCERMERKLAPLMFSDLADVLRNFIDGCESTRFTPCKFEVAVPLATEATIRKTSSEWLLQVSSGPLVEREKLYFVIKEFAGQPNNPTHGRDQGIQFQKGDWSRDGDRWHAAKTLPRRQDWDAQVLVTYRSELLATVYPEPVEPGEPPPGEIQPASPTEAATSSVALPFNGWVKQAPIGSGGGAVGVYRAIRALEDPVSIERKIGELHEAVRAVAISKLLSDRKRERQALYHAVAAIAQSATSSHKEGALKIYVREGEKAADAKLKRIAREVEAMKNLEGTPNALRLLDQGDSPVPWIVTELHGNGSLADRSLRDRFAGDFVGALRALRPIAALLAEIHRRRFVHRDVAPKNIFMADDGRLVLGDWGIVRWNDDDHSILTQSEDVMGTKDMMAQWLRIQEYEHWPPNSDIYAWGKTLWMLVRGKSTILNREDWAVPQFDLTLLFPNARGIALLKEVLSQTVVPDPAKCLPDGSALLALVDQVLDRIDRGFEDTGEGAGQRCRACGEGRYRPHAILDPGESFELPPSASRGGLGLAEGAFVHKTLSCERCGHLMLYAWPRGSTVAGSEECVSEGLRHPDPAVRGRTATTWGGEEKFAAALVAHLPVEKDRRVVRSILRVLRTKKPPPGGPGAVSTFTDGDIDKVTRDLAEKLLGNWRSSFPDVT